MIDLADALVADKGAVQTLELRQGVIAQTSPLLVRVGSATTAQPARAVSGFPGGPVGATVSVLVVDDSDRIVLGRAKTAAEPQYRALHGVTGTTSGGTTATLASVSTAPQGIPGFYYVHATAYLSFAGGPDYYELTIIAGGLGYGSARINAGHGAASWDDNYSVSAFIPHDGVTAPQITLTLTRTAGGTGGAASFLGTDPRYLSLHTVFFGES